MSLYAKGIEINNVGSISANGSNLDITCVGDLRFSSSAISTIVSPSIDLVGGQIHNTSTIVCSDLLTDVSFNVNTTGTNKIKFITSNIDRLTLDASGNAPSFQSCPRTSLDIVAGSTSARLMTMATFNNNFSYTPVLNSSGGGFVDVYTSTYGFYTQIAKMIFFSIRLGTTTITSLNAGNLSISLPFRAADTTNRIGCNIGTINNVTGTSNATDFYAAILSEADDVSLFFRIIGNTSTTGPLTKSNISSNFSITLSGVYFIL